MPPKEAESYTRALVLPYLDEPCTGLASLAITCAIKVHDRCLNNDNNNRNIYTGETLSVLQALDSVRALVRMKSKDNLRKSKLIHIQCKSVKCPSILIVKNVI